MIMDAQVHLPDGSASCIREGNAFASRFAIHAFIEKKLQE